MAIGSIAKGMSSAMAEYLKTERTRQREEEDKSIDYQMKIIDMLAGRPDMNPAMLGKALTDLSALQGAKGQRKSKGGQAGFMGETEMPISALLESLKSGLTPMMGDTTEAVPEPAKPVSGTLPLMMPDGVGPAPLPGPPQSLDMAAIQPYADWKTSGGRREVENQPMLLSPDAMARRSAAAGVTGKDVTTEGEIARIKGLGLSKADEDAAIRHAMGIPTTGGFRFDTTPLIYKLKDGTLIEGYQVGDQSSGQFRVQDRFGRPLPPDAQPLDPKAATAETDPVSFKEFERVVADEKARGITTTADKGYDAWLTSDANRKAVRNINQITPTGEANLLIRLQNQWDTSQKALLEVQRQFALMQTGLSRFDADPNGASQAILVTFQKILDPQSVVRESEYARSPQGLALMSRFEGYVQRLAKGGAGVPKAELAQMVETARQFVENTQTSANQIRNRSKATAERYGLPADLVIPNLPADEVGGSGGGVDKAMQDILDFLKK